jgi:hypothetical protein
MKIIRFFFICIAIVENMTEFRPTLCVDACKQGLLACLLKRLKVGKRI